MSILRHECGALGEGLGDQQIIERILMMLRQARECFQMGLANVQKSKPVTLY